VTAGTATKPAADKRIQVGERRIQPNDVVKVSFGGEADWEGMYFLGYDWDYWGRVVLRTGETVDCGRERAEKLVNRLKVEGPPLTWRDEYRGDYSWSDEYFSPEVIEAATERRFFALGNWHDCPWSSNYYQKLVRKTFAGRDPRAVKIPTREGVLTCNPDVFEDYVGFDDQGRGQVRVGGEVFTTKLQAVTRRVEVAAREDFSAAWAKLRGVPVLPTEPGRPGVSGVAR